MWLEFWLAFALLSALLVVPGALALAACGARPVVALAAGPLVSVVAYGAMGVALAALGVPASTLLVAGPPVLLGLALLVGRYALHRAGEKDRRPRLAPARRHELALLALYVAAGVAVTALMLVSSLPTPDDFVQAWDNVAHFNIVRSMSQSGVWSTLSVTYYPGAAAAVNPLEVGAHYYPAAWHVLAVMLVDALGVSVACAANVVNAVSCAVLLPMGSRLLLSRVLPRNPRAVALGALVCLAFPSVPWNLIPRWTLYPNLLSFALLPAVIAAFMALAAPAARRVARVRAGAVFLVGCAALYLAQPNSVFSAAVFLAPWVGWRLYAWRRGRGEGPGRAWAWVGAWALLVVALWVVLLHLPFLSGVVEYYWKPIAGLQSCVEGVFGLSFAAGPPRYVLRLLVVVGLVAALLTPRLRWLPVPFLFSCVAFVVAGGMDTPLKNVLAGFWYTDPYRMAAMAALFAVPLAALGVGEVVGAARRLLARWPRAARAVGALVAALVAAGLYLPALLARLGLPALHWPADNFYALAQEFSQKHDAASRAGYDAEKIAFVERALALTGEDGVVLNQPYDGSVYAYGVSGMNVVYRYMSGYGASDEDWLERDASRLLRTRLAGALAGMDPLAADGLAELGVEYLLVLDRDIEGMEAAFTPFVVADWAGMLAVSDETPGLEVLLAEGDMRLYRVVGAA